MSTHSETAATRGGKVLFVDDEALSLKYFKAAVGRYADVVTAENPDAAMKILAAEGDAISVVVSDERMPRESGVAFLSNVRKSWPATVRILTSAYSNIDLQEAINSAAISRFVPKPWNFDELCSVLQEALRGDTQSEISGDLEEAESEAPAANHASLELLAVLSRELSGPLAEIDAESLRVTALVGAESPIVATAQPVASWSRRVRLGQISASASRIQSLVDQCRSLAGPIAALADGLAAGVTPGEHSMAETVAGVSERLAKSNAGRMRLTIDARRDFRYRTPKKIVEYVLAEQLKSSHALTENSPFEIAISLVPGLNYNEVEITIADGRATMFSSEAMRASRCALWAFGAELLLDGDGESATTRLRFPIADAMPRQPKH